MSKIRQMSKTSNKLFAAWLVFVLLLMISFVLAGFGTPSVQKASVCSVQPASFNCFTSAKAMCVMEADSGRVLFAKNCEQKLAMASTTKIMTAITAIENCSNLDQVFEISPKAVGVPGTSLYLKKGEHFSTRQLLYGLMLISGNDASVAIGEHVGGTVTNFVEMMNVLAKKIGATDTHFDNTHGLDSKTHYTTAKDLALITSYAMKNDTFREIVSTKNMKITSGEGQIRYLRNKNKLLSLLPDCDGVKTGFTDDAGRCLVSSCCRDGMRLVCVVLNCGPMFEESAALLESGFDQFRRYNLANFFNIPHSISVQDGKAESVKIGTRGEKYYPLSLKELDAVKIELQLCDKLVAPVQKGEKVGKISIFLGKDLLFCENIYTIEDVRSDRVWEGVKDILSNW